MRRAAASGPGLHHITLNGWSVTLQKPEVCRGHHPEGQSKSFSRSVQSNGERMGNRSERGIRTDASRLRVYESASSR